MIVKQPSPRIRPESSNNKAPYTLERDQRLSASVLWRLGREYYSTQGPAAWASGTVPMYPTSNPFIARAYAQVVLAYLRDCRQGALIDPQSPIYIVELAAGSGRFSHLFLQRFCELKAASSCKSLDVRFVMTDLAETNLRAWMEQPRFHPYVESGVLDFSLFDMESTDHLQLLRSGERIAADTLKNPLVVVANYGFDSVAPDVFRFTHGMSQEGLLTTSVPGQHQCAPADATLLPRLQLRFTYRPFAGSYYDHPEFDRILDHYRTLGIDAPVLFPLGALRCIERLITLARGQLLLLSSDMGYTHEDELISMTEQDMIRIYGATAAPVNYHAIGRYFVERGGQVVTSAQRLGVLKTAAFLLGASADALADTRLAFSDYVDHFGPAHFHSLFYQLRPVAPNVTLELFLDLLRLSDWDPYVFMAFKNQLPAQLQYVSVATHHELRIALTKVWQNFHPMDGDLPFELARLYLALNEPREALRYCALSSELFGDHPSTHFNRGLCYYQARDFAAAAQSFACALQHKQEHATAALWLTHARAEQQLPEDYFLPTEDKEG